jgi:hypothetical protein
MGAIYCPNTVLQTQLLFGLVEITTIDLLYVNKYVIYLKIWIPPMAVPDLKWSSIGGRLNHLFS